MKIEKLKTKHSNEKKKGDRMAVEENDDVENDDDIEESKNEEMMKNRFY